MTAERKDYSKMSPEELRQEVEELFGHVPVGSGPDSEAHLSGEYVEMAKQRLERILERSHLTESLRRLVLVDFRISTKAGHGSESREVLTDRFMNVFDEDLAKDAARKLIKHFESRAIGEAVLHASLEDKGIEMPPFVSIYIQPAKREFLEKYGEEA